MVGRLDGPTPPVAQPIIHTTAVAVLRHVQTDRITGIGLRGLGGLELDEHWWSAGPCIFPRAPHIWQCGENIGGPKTPRRPLARALLRRASERMRAQRRSIGGRRAARQKCADEPGEQVTTAPGREAGIATRDDMFWPAQIGDDGGNAFEQHGALELRGGAPGGGPAIVGGFVRQRVAGERSELTKVRSADKRATRSNARVPSTRVAEFDPTAVGS